jgi:hypothetical protein
MREQVALNVHQPPFAPLPIQCNRLVKQSYARRQIPAISLRKIILPLLCLINITQHISRINHHSLPLFQICSQIPSRDHTQLLATIPANPQLTPCTAPLALLIVDATHHASHGLKRVVTPHSALMRRITIEVRRRDARNELLRPGNWGAGQWHERWWSRGVFFDGG